jgi:hypothetical protein
MIGERALRFRYNRKCVPSLPVGKSKGVAGLYDGWAAHCQTNLQDLS